MSHHMSIAQAKCRTLLRTASLPTGLSTVAPPKFRLTTQAVPPQTSISSGSFGVARRQSCGDASSIVLRGWQSLSPGHQPLFIAAMPSSERSTAVPSSERGLQCGDGGEERGNCADNVHDRSSSYSTLSAEHRVRLFCAGHSTSLRICN